MKLNKNKELDFISNDVYVLEKINKHLIINNDYQGLLLVDGHLEVVNSFYLPKSPPIYSLLKNNGGNEVLLYCPEENLIYCSLITKEAISIKIDHIEDCISSLYYWNDKKVVLSTYSFNFYEFDYKNHLIKEITLDIIKTDNPSFYKFCKEIQKNIPYLRINSLEMTFIYKDENKNQIIFFDFKDKKKVIVENPEIDYHDVIFCNGYFVFVAEDQLLIIKNEETYRYPMNEPLHIFLKVTCLIENEALFIFALVSNESDSKKSKIIKYCLID